MNRIASAFAKLKWAKRSCSAFLMCVMTIAVLSGQTFISLHSFDGTDGSGPQDGLVQAINGYLYGTTPANGANNYGTAFKITPGGNLTAIYNFCSKTNCADGASPYAGLTQATNGYLYGTTFTSSTIFRMTPSGTPTTLYTFCSKTDCADGEGPYAGLVQAANGVLYGTTESGGANGMGTVFKVSPSGELTTLYSFCAQTSCSDGAQPPAGLIQATNGDFYGTTVGGGAHGAGTVFKITPSGTLTTLYSFCSQSNCADGSGPFAGLVQSTSGYLYGTTLDGGACSFTGGCGTIFKITPSGTLTTVYSFCALANCADGVYPYGALVQATNGKLYGTTSIGGGVGTVFELTPNGTLTTLHSFCSETNCTDGLAPMAGLVQATNGDFYGTTEYGGSSVSCMGGCGTVFRLSLGLSPFVRTLPSSGVVGEAVKILGTNLTGATSVSFNGVAALFTVVSSTEITTTVPTGATTGAVEVVIPSRTLSSNVPFRLP